MGQITVIRVLIADGEGKPIFDSIVRPLRQKGQANSFYTGITYEQMSKRP